MKTIIKERYYVIMGLLAIAKRHNEALSAIELALMDITGDVEMSHCGDACFGDSTADELLRKLGISVETSPTP